MAKATVISEQGAGEYVVKVIYDTARAEARKVDIEAQIASISNEMVALGNVIAALEVDKTNALTAMDLAINDANNNTPNNQEFSKFYSKIVEKATLVISEINKNLAENDLRFGTLAIDKAAKEVELRITTDALNIYTNPINVTAWCTDYTENLVGDVGVLAIDDETNAPNNQGLIIGPGGVTEDPDLLITFTLELAAFQAQLVTLNSELVTLKDTNQPIISVKEAEKTLLQDDLDVLQSELEFLRSELIGLSGVSRNLKISEINSKLLEVKSKQDAVVAKQDEIQTLLNEITTKFNGVQDKQTQINLKVAQIKNNGNQEIQPAISSGQWAIAYNIASMPAFQKWKPRYRKAVISNINTVLDTCRVSFAAEHEFSSIVGFEHNQKYSMFQGVTIDNVPIEYMTCNSAVFSNNDNVIVNFSGDWKTPKVIGFVDNPAQCQAGGIMCWPRSQSQDIGRQLAVLTPAGVLTSSLLSDTTLFSYNCHFDRIIPNSGGELDILSWAGPHGFHIPSPTIIINGTGAQPVLAGLLVDTFSLSNSEAILSYHRSGVAVFSGGKKVGGTFTSRILGAGVFNNYLIVIRYVAPTVDVVHISQAPYVKGEPVTFSGGTAIFYTADGANTLLPRNGMYVFSQSTGEASIVQPSYELLPTETPPGPDEAILRNRVTTLKFTITVDQTGTPTLSQTVSSTPTKGFQTNLVVTDTITPVLCDGVQYYDAHAITETRSTIDDTLNLGVAYDGDSLLTLQAIMSYTQNNIINSLSNLNSSVSCNTTGPFPDTSWDKSDMLHISTNINSLPTGIVLADGSVSDIKSTSTPITTDTRDVVATLTEDIILFYDLVQGNYISGGMTGTNTFTQVQGQPDVQTAPHTWFNTIDGVKTNRGTVQLPELLVNNSPTEWYWVNLTLNPFNHLTKLFFRQAPQYSTFMTGENFLSAVVDRYGHSFYSIYQVDPTTDPTLVPSANPKHITKHIGEQDTSILFKVAGVEFTLDGNLNGFEGGSGRTIGIL